MWFNAIQYYDVTGTFWIADDKTLVVWPSQLTVAFLIEIYLRAFLCEIKE
jgi:hypothetical protein